MTIPLRLSVAVVALAISAPPAFSQGYAERIHSLEPVAYFQFDGESGEATLKGATLDKEKAMHPPAYPGFTADNQCVTLDGKDNSVDLGEPLIQSLANSDGISVEAWVRLNSAKDSAVIQAPIYEKVLGLLIEVEGKGIRFRARSSAGEALQNNFIGNDSFGGPFADTDWHHLVAVFDFANGKAQMYVDGKQVADRANEDWKNQSYNAAKRTTGAVAGAAMEGGNFLEGGIDEIAFYNKALSEEEVAANFAAAKSGE